MPHIYVLGAVFFLIFKFKTMFFIIILLIIFLFGIKIQISSFSFETEGVIKKIKQLKNAIKRKN